jgi:putative flippase GtrA
LIQTVEHEAYPTATASVNGAHQFVKFCIIGFTSTVIDFAILNLLIRRFGVHWAIASVISFTFAVTNGFIWNSLWTFRGMGSAKRHEQYIKFVAVNIVGLLLNLGIIKTILILINGSILHSGPQNPTHVNMAKCVAIVFVSIWNFFANKKWTFS